MTFPVNNGVPPSTFLQQGLYIPSFDQWNTWLTGKVDASSGQLLNPIITANVPMTITAPALTFVINDQTYNWPVGSGAALPLTGGQLSGPLLIGTGTQEGSPYQFQSAWNIDPSASSPAGGFFRYNKFITTLTYATADTTNVVDGAGLLHQVYVNGPHTATGEINVNHAYMQVNAGANVASSELYEGSFQNSGTMGQHIGFLFQPINRAAGTITTLYGFSSGVENDVGGVISNFALLNLEPVTGTAPANYWLMRGNEPLAAITTKGGLAVGTIQNPGAGQVIIIGPDNAGGTYPFVVKSNNLTNCFFVGDDAVVHFHTGSWDQNGNITATSIDNGATTGLTVFKNGSKGAFYGGTPALKQTVTGSKGANAALTSLMTALSAIGLVTDSTT